MASSTYAGIDDGLAADAVLLELGELFCECARLSTRRGEKKERHTTIVPVFHIPPAHPDKSSVTINQKNETLHKVLITEATTKADEGVKAQKQRGEKLYTKGECFPVKPKHDERHPRRLKGMKDTAQCNSEERKTWKALYARDLRPERMRMRMALSVHEREGHNPTTRLRQESERSTVHHVAKAREGGMLSNSRTEAQEGGEKLPTIGVYTRLVKCNWLPECDWLPDGFDGNEIGACCADVSTTDAN
ncbi:hypothetical protein B0H14DRAFT_3729831 [Mycena olivaceomarginata]|nr:hypothetical protein B0H14DRAFT_3729831 [Mycena olivaceomarginata]